MPARNSAATPAPDGQNRLLKAPLSPDTLWGTRIFVISIIFPLLATVAAIARFAARKLKRNKPGIDDWLIVIGLFFHYGHAVTGILTVIEGGAGQDISKLNPSVFERAYKALFAAQIGYGLALGAIKSSVCALLIRIFGVNKRFKILIYALMVFSIAWGLMVVGTALFDCHPIPYNWDKSVHGSCDNQPKAFVAVAATDIVSDLAILIVPIPGVWRLQMSKTMKVALSAAFALGFLDVVVGILRIIATNQLDFRENWTYQLGPVHFWSTMEPGIAIVVASSVVLRPVIEKLVPARLVSKASSYVRKQPYDSFSRIEDGTLPLKDLSHSTSLSASHRVMTAGHDDFLFSQATTGDATAESRTSLPRAQQIETPSVINVRKDILVHEEQK